VLIDFKVTNFLSIKDELDFSLIASNSNELRGNVAPYKHGGVLKSSGIYGPNASGKSNIIKAIFFLWQLVKYSHSYNVDAKIQITQFKLDDESKEEPSRFEITFTKNSATYQYGFSCLNSKIIREYLFRWDDTYKKCKSKI
jgi:AAA15 family ATPase/GTPase